MGLNTEIYIAQVIFRLATWLLGWLFGTRKLIEIMVEVSRFEVKERDM